MSKLCRPGTKRPLHQNELPMDMLAELIDLFTSQQGSVLDPFCCTMTTLIASLNIGLHRSGIERNKARYDAVLDKLIEYIPSPTRTTRVNSESPDVAFNSKLSYAERLLGIFGEADGKGEAIESYSG